MSEHDSLCGMTPTSPRFDFAPQVIADMRQRFFDGVDSEILVMQNPMRRLQHYAEQCSYEAYQRRLVRFVGKMGVTSELHSVGD